MVRPSVTSRRRPQNIKNGDRKDWRCCVRREADDEAGGREDAALRGGQPHAERNRNACGRCSTTCNIQRVWRDMQKARADLSTRRILCRRGPANLGYGATGSDIGWAVLDTGIRGRPPAFHRCTLTSSAQWNCTKRGAPSDCTCRDRRIRTNLMATATAPMSRLQSQARCAVCSARRRSSVRMRRHCSGGEALRLQGARPTRARARIPTSSKRSTRSPRSTSSLIAAGHSRRQSQPRRQL